MDWLLRRIARLGFRRALAGEHRAWIAIAIAAFVLRRARRPAEPVAFSTRLRAGDRYEVSLVDPRPPGAGS
ncbi:MAG TPA: hypothetical protein VGL60_07420 [Acidimicrobiales bacterium]